MPPSRSSSGWRAVRSPGSRTASTPTSAPCSAGTPPSAVVLRTAVANAALVALALVSIRHPILAMAGAAVVVAGLLVELERLARA